MPAAAACPMSRGTTMLLLTPPATVSTIRRTRSKTVARACALSGLRQAFVTSVPGPWTQLLKTSKQCFTQMAAGALLTPSPRAGMAPSIALVSARKTLGRLSANAALSSLCMSAGTGTCFSDSAATNICRTRKAMSSPRLAGCKSRSSRKAASCFGQSTLDIATTASISLFATKRSGTLGSTERQASRACLRKAACSPLSGRCSCFTSVSTTLARKCIVAGL
mmetsp:Transcript_4963/g.19854  ORF Transcript_4963/g.19854 Transcript_4963/m.19854 type:complete len:222 (+) Transcript_4963:2071-2736(+)